MTEFDFVSCKNWGGTKALVSPRVLRPWSFHCLSKTKIVKAGLRLRGTLGLIFQENLYILAELKSFY